jgi:hypothetical protein
LILKSLTLVFVYDSLSLKKTLVTFVLILINSRFETNPMVSSTVVYK